MWHWYKGNGVQEQFSLSFAVTIKAKCNLSCFYVQLKAVELGPIQLFSSGCNYLVWQIRWGLVHVCIFLHRQHSQICVHLGNVWLMKWMGGAESVRSLLLGWSTLIPGVAEWTTSWLPRHGNAWKSCQQRRDWSPLLTRGRLGSGG